MAYDLVLAASALVVCGLAYLWQVQRQQRSPNVPLASKIPLIGPTLLVFRHAHRMLDMMVDMALQTKGPFQFHIVGHPNYVGIIEPEAVKHVLSDNFDNYVKGDFFRDRFFDLLGDGIFDVDGDKWQFQRKTASHIFTRNELRGFMTDVFRDHVALAVDRLDKFAAAQQPINLQDLFYRFTLESIGKIAFGINLGCFEDAHNEFASSFDTAQQILMDRMFTPIWPLRRVLWFLVPDEIRLRKCIRTLDTLARQIIQTRRQEVDLEHKEDLLSRFMHVTNNGQPLSDDQLRNVIMNFVIAGRDTTANALTWFFDEILQHPDVEEKLLAEIDTVLAGSAPTYEDADKRLPYLTACVKETLRLHPSVPKDTKQAVADDVLPDGTVIKAGSSIVYLPYVTGRMEKFWPRAAEFLPERWLTMETAPSPFYYPVFNAGPRLCLGMNMAYTEAKIAAASILQKYRFKRVSAKRGEYLTAVTLPMAGGLSVTIQRRA
eukprot:m.130478 g.130478  ORF g.130478 m.130478 type:complete len:489 (-) comp9451_c1_seq1:186-1652(-)